MTRLGAILWLALATPVTHAGACGGEGAWLQVLGSGGPDISGQRAASGYVLWLDGKARALVDTGTGTALRFAEAGANFADLDVILLTHLHADHVGDLPAFIASRQAQSRKRPLPLFGPGGNRGTPSTVAFVRTLFDPTRGAYRYLSDVLTPQDSERYKLRPRDVMTKARDSGPTFKGERVSAQAVATMEGPIPALAWRVRLGGRDFAFLGDAGGNDERVAELARGADIVIAPSPASERDQPALTLAAKAVRPRDGAAPRLLVFSHRTTRASGDEAGIANAVKREYGGAIAFAEDLSCFQP